MIDEKEINENEIIRNDDYYEANNKKIKIKLIISFVIIAITLFGAAMFIMIGLNDREKTIVLYNENGSIDYKVKVKPSTMYPEEYREKGQSYITKDTELVKTDIKYNISSNRVSKINTDYKVTGKIVLTEKNEPNKVLSNIPVTIKESVKKESETVQTISDTVLVDNQKYESQVIEWKKESGMSLSAKLILNYVIKTTATNDIVSDVFESTNEMSIQIPIGEETFQITTPKSTISNTKQFIKLGDYQKMNYVYFAVGGLFAAVTIFLIVKTFFIYSGQRMKESEYEKTKRNILREFDRIIVEADNIQNGKEFDSVINVKTFNELVDVRDNLERPILFHENKRKRISTFTVVDNDLVYVYKIKEQ